MHFDLLDHMHKRGGAADDHRMEPQSEEQPFSEAMLAKVYTIIPLLWRCAFDSIDQADTWQSPRCWSLASRCNCLT